MAEKGIQAILFTEAGRDRGNGHVSRCTGLYEAFLQAGYGARMWVDTDEPLSGGIATGDWKRSLDRFLPAGGPPNLIAIVDSYEADRSLLETIASRARICCFFDDYSRLDYPDGIVVNAAIDADFLYPIRHQGVRYLTGPRYAILRKAFWRIRLYSVRDHAERILVALGSAVAGDEAVRVAVAVQRLLSEAELIVLMPDAATPVPAIQRKGIRCLWLSDPERLVDLALNSDVAVCAGGQILVEMACIGVPAVAVQTAINQQANLSSFTNAGYAIDAGPLASPAFLRRLHKALGALQPAAERSQRSSQGRRLIDGQGAVRMVQTLTCLACLD